MVLKAMGRNKFDKLAHLRKMERVRDMEQILSELKF